MYFNYEGTPVYYDVQGEGEALLLLHGWGADGRSFINIVRHYGDKFRVVTPDFPPFGLSGELKKDYALEDYKNLVIALMDFLNINKFSVICHSFGGRVASLLAAENPDRVNKIVFCSAAGIPKRKTVAMRLKHFMYCMTKFLAQRGIVKENALKRYFSSDYASLPEGMRKTFVNIIGKDVSKSIKSVRCPALLIWGRKDRETPLYMARLYKKYIPDSRLEILENCGHFSFIDDFAGFIRLTDGFLL